MSVQSERAKPVPVIDRPPTFLEWMAKRRAAGEKRTGSVADLRQYMRDVWGRR